MASAAVLLVPDCCTRVVLAAAGWLAGQGAGFSLAWVCAVAGTRPRAPPRLPPEPAALVEGHLPCGFVLSFF